MLTAFGCAIKPDRFPPAPAGRRVLADLHIHAMINEWNRKTPIGVRYPAVARFAEKFVNKTGMKWSDCHAAGIDLICAAHFNVFDEWLSMPTDPNPEAPANTYRMLDQLEEELEGPASPYAKLARNADEMDKILSVSKSDPAWRMAVVHTVEGGHALGGSIAPLETLARRGVAMIDITHFFSKNVASSGNAYPYFPDGNSRWPNLGLSEYGREVISEMERLGIIVDVTHATPTAVRDVLEIATRPVAVSHGAPRTLADHPLCLYDEHIQQIAATGGIIGVIVGPYLLTNYATAHLAEKKGSLRDVVRVVRYIVKLCGSHKHVGIGSDFAGYIMAPTDMNRLSQVERLRRMLYDEFGSHDVVEDIMANNTIDFLKANWKSGM